MKIQSVQDLFLSGLQYIYDAEKQLIIALPELAQAATAPQLREVFEQHLRETKEHVGRIEEVFKRIGEQPQTQANAVLDQMRQHARQMIENSDKSEIRDAALIIAGNQVEHYEISAYGSLRTFAQLLGHDEVVAILQKTLDEEKKADARLTDVADSQINIQALHKSAALAAAL
jgi:ferritin-like metal-binding protein YciE